MGLFSVDEMTNCKQIANWLNEFTHRVVHIHACGENSLLLKTSNKIKCQLIK